MGFIEIKRTRWGCGQTRRFFIQIKKKQKIRAGWTGGQSRWRRRRGEGKKAEAYIELNGSKGQKSYAPQSSSSSLVHRYFVQINILMFLLLLFFKWKWNFMFWLRYFFVRCVARIFFEQRKSFNIPDLIGLGRLYRNLEFSNFACCW